MWSRLLVLNLGERGACLNRGKHGERGKRGEDTLIQLVILKTRELERKTLFRALRAFRDSDSRGWKPLQQDRGWETPPTRGLKKGALGKHQINGMNAI